MDNKKFENQMDGHFNVHDDSNYIELETWTEGGVNMFVTIQKEEGSNHFKQFKEYVDGFDVDEQIDIHREDQNYKNNFTVRKSLEDFETYHEWLKSVLTKLDTVN